MSDYSATNQKLAMLAKRIPAESKKKLILETANKTINIPLIRAGSRTPNTPYGNGIPLYFQSTLAGDPRIGGVVEVNVQPCHAPGCTCNSKKKDYKCTCGAEELFYQFVESLGESVVLPGFETVEKIFGWDKGEDSK